MRWLILVFLTVFFTSSEKVTLSLERSELNLFGTVYKVVPERVSTGEVTLFSGKVDGGGKNGHIKQ